MRHNFGRKSYTNPLNTGCQKKRKLHGKIDWFIISSVIGFRPFCSFRVENNFQRERSKPSFNISRCRSRIAGKNISPVSLRIDQQLFLANLHHRIGNRSISVRVIFHGIPYKICNFIVTPIFKFPHGVHDPTLYRLESIKNRRNGPVENNVGGVV